MYYYFASGFPSAVKINGTFLGIISNETKFCDVESNNAFVEICSLSTTEPSVNFLLNEDFLLNPPENVTITDLKGGYLIKCNALCLNEKFCLLSQEKTDLFIASVFTDNGLKISIETPYDFFADQIRLTVKSAKIEHFFLNNHTFVLIYLISDKQHIIVYDVTNKIEKVLLKEVFSCSIENGFETIERRQDIAKHEIKTEWTFDEKFTAKNVTIATSPDFTLNSLPLPVIPYAFAEELLTSGNVSCYLSDKMKPNANKLKGYLGNFIGIMPPPIFRKDNEVGFIYKLTENKYEVRYYTFEFLDGKIDNIISCD